MTIRAHAARALGALPAPARFKVRNQIVLACWLARRLAGRGDGGDAYSDTFWDSQYTGDWAGLAELICSYSGARSLLDIGCGDGRLLAAIQSHDPSVRILGLDSSAAALARARQKGLLVAQHDLSIVGPGATTKLKALAASFDVAISLETAEHLPPWGGRRLITLLTRAPTVIFSAAHPGQGGTWHMNERPFEYWRGLFHARGFDLSVRDEAFRGAVRQLRLPWWYAANVHLLERAPR